LREWRGRLSSCPAAETPAILVIEIPLNPNCDSVEMRVFHDLGPPRPVVQVRMEAPAGGGGPQWRAVTGWTAAGTACPALARKVDDSGEGVVLLVSGGDAGLRLQVAGRNAPWRLDDPSQWGAPFLLLPGADDLRFAPAAGEQGR
jgi:hypothetical protein